MVKIFYKNLRAIFKCTIIDSKGAQENSNMKIATGEFVFRAYV